MSKLMPLAAGLLLVGCIQNDARSPSAPIPFEELINPSTGRAKIRMVDIHSTRYAIARRYMLRLRRDDFEDPHELAKFAATAGMSLADFRKEFEYLIEWELPPLVFGSEPEGGVSKRDGVVMGLDPAP